MVAEKLKVDVFYKIAEKMPAVNFVFYQTETETETRKCSFQSQRNRHREKSHAKILERNQRRQKTMAETVGCKHPAEAAMASLNFLLSPSRKAQRRKAQERKSQKPDREETDKMPTQADQNHTEPLEVILG